MRVPLVAPVRDLLAARARAAAVQAIAAGLVAAFALASAGFATAAAVVALSARLGFPLAALMAAAVFAVLALVSHLIGGAISRRRMAQARLARDRAGADLAMAAALSGPARPLLPLLAFLAAYLLARRP